MGKAADNERLRLRANVLQHLGRGVRHNGPVRAVFRFVDRVGSNGSYVRISRYRRLGAPTRLNGGPVRHRSGPPAWFSIPAHSRQNRAIHSRLMALRVISRQRCRREPR